MDGNKSCDIAKDNQNNATTNENCKKKFKGNLHIRKCDLSLAK